jgi:hypothetical protein
MIEGLIPKPPAPILLQLADRQAKHLAWCEDWGNRMPEVAGVRICKAMSYDLIQVLNRSLIG